VARRLLRLIVPLFAAELLRTRQTRRCHTETAQRCKNGFTESERTSTVRANDRQAFALAVAPLAAAVANYCDHVEHNDPADPSWVTDAGEELSDLAFEHGTAGGYDLVQLYADRLATIEARNVLAEETAFDGSAAALAAATWRELQLVQSAHDRAYHPDVVGMSRLDQLRHYAFHLAKIVGAFAEGREESELFTRRLPDALLFAIKLRTVMGVRLSDDRLPRGVNT
jgi:hypothetical protein